MSLIDSYYFSLFIICCISGVILREWDEYCATETFHPNCPPGFYVFVTYAEFGRMNNGRCISGLYGILGCASNVEAVLNRMCFGPQRCKVRIPDGRLEVEKSCPRDLRRYLNASYTCVPITDLPEEICRSHGLFELRNDTGFLSSRSIQQLSCSPLSFTIRGKRGKQVVVSLFDWTLRTSNYRCQSIGFISDSRRNVTICAGRSGIIFNTTAERVKITLKNGHGDFLLKYKISGCPDPDMPSGKSWLRREGDQAILGCNATKHNWKLTCDPGNGRWRGEKAYSCPEERSGDEDERGGIDNWNEMSLPQGVSVAIIIGTALVVGVIILVIGLMCLERLRKASNSTASEPDIYLHALMPPGGGSAVEDNKPDVTAYYERTATINKKPRTDLNVHELYGCVHDDVDLQSLKMSRKRNDTEENNVRFLTLPVRSILCKNTNIQQASAQKLLDASQLANLPDSAFS